MSSIVDFAYTVRVTKTECATYHTISSTATVTASTTNAVTELREKRCFGGVEAGSVSRLISRENSNGHGNTMNMM